MTGNRGLGERWPTELDGLRFVSLLLPLVVTYAPAHADEVLDALGDPTRRAVLELLRDGPRAVGEIAADLPVSRPAVSQHLRVLKGAGLVTERRQGTRRLYRVDPEGLTALRVYLESFWTDVLAAFKAAAEQEGADR